MWSLNKTKISGFFFVFSEGVGVPFCTWIIIFFKNLVHIHVYYYVSKKKLDTFRFWCSKNSMIKLSLNIFDFTQTCCLTVYLIMLKHRIVNCQHTPTYFSKVLTFLLFISCCYCYGCCCWCCCYDCCHCCYCYSSAAVVVLIVMAVVVYKIIF